MKRMYVILFALAIMLMMSITVSAINTPYNVIGYVTVNGAYQNGVEVTLYNNRTGDTLTSTNQSTLTTYAGAAHNGIFQGNLGNMDTQWQAGDLIRVNATYAGHTARTTFNITATQSIYKYANISISYSDDDGGAGGPADTGDSGSGGLGIDLDKNAMAALGILIALIALAAFAAIAHDSGKKYKNK